MNVNERGVYGQMHPGFEPRALYMLGTHFAAELYICSKMGHFGLRNRSAYSWDGEMLVEEKKE